ncbi:MAG: dihydrofolate reductase [Proteobacteria bacterium]|nr:dihydrofolate reductase [Pseudomonadota bacterium]MBU1139635.1 dihydrofolate reductase [Pseudomonadota bacterium]MBU1233030.1 dihydrofolate reductase [Pseudomonadota bacterium]MBU1420799.1 dihydrofolate reductase [Pseudomonadota bacterium]MBU1454867.1 dihydrofolate reductase [Pseudomonadota bacterium]
MEIILIAAMGRNRVIGRNNAIPWHIPEEMHHFKTTTMGHAVIMGRKTFESMGKALPGRFNVVLTRDTDLHFPGCTTAGNFTEAIQCCQGQEKVFVIGGRAIYQDSMTAADTILLSVLDEDYEGDTFFPAIPETLFHQVAEKRIGRAHPYTLFIYKRKDRG